MHYTKMMFLIFIEVKVSSRQWNDQLVIWKDGLQNFKNMAEEANKALLTNTSLNDFDHAATFEKEVTVEFQKTAEFAILKLTNGKRALLHANRAWVGNNPMYNGFYVLKKASFKSIQVNARSISPPHAGVEYQVRSNLFLNKIRKVNFHSFCQF